MHQRETSVNGSCMVYKNHSCEWCWAVVQLTLIQQLPVIDYSLRKVENCVIFFPAGVEFFQVPET